MCEDQGIKLLIHESIEIGGFKIFGSPYTPFFHNWAFNIFRGEGLVEKWSQIPDDTQVLITHGPPMGILDEVISFNGKKCEWEVEKVGCAALYNRIQELKSLKLHIFGHIHPGAGTKQINGVTYINASTCNEQYKPVNGPMIFSL
jgi:Icc-related predicted phosphoesterase